jgi:hypothetical protein
MALAWFLGLTLRVIIVERNSGPLSGRFLNVLAHVDSPASCRAGGDTNLPAIRHMLKLPFRMLRTDPYEIVIMLASSRIDSRASSIA